MVEFSNNNIKVVSSFRIYRHGARIGNANPIPIWFREKGYDTPYQLTKKGEQ